MVLSPGGLRGISLAQLESAQAAVNQNLYSIAKKLRTSDNDPIIEGEGGGIAQVFRLAEEEGLPRPTFINTGVQFTAFLWRPSAQPTPRRSSMSNQDKVVAVISRLGQATVRELAAQTQLSEGQVRYALRKVIEGGAVQMVGGVGEQETFYRLSPRMG